MMQPTTRHPQTWQAHTFTAMGSQMAVWVEAAPAAAAAAFAQVEALFAANEQALSRFRRDSELSRLNVRSGDWTPVSELMWDVLTLALGMAAVTNGRFDPTLLNSIHAAGYTHSFASGMRFEGNGRLPSGVLTGGHWLEIALDEARRAVRLPAGVGVDLGGIAKGYTAQQAVALLEPVGPCLVDAGGDLAAGAAPHGYPGWPIAISKPGAAVETADLAQLWLANAAAATSGIDYRCWVQDGHVMHHVLDPATGQPAVTDSLTVTVLAADAAQAEAWATATLVAGSDDGMAALLEMELAGLLVTQTGRILVTPAMQSKLNENE